MQKDTLRSVIYTKIDELPTLPAVVPRILSLMQDPGTDTRRITEAISNDPAMTSKILKVANSAYYGFPQKITSLERAVALLGFNMVKSLALSVGVIRSLPSPALSGLFDIRSLWVHSLAVATAMRALAEDLGKVGEIESLFIVGLLHDLGKVLLAEFFPEEFGRALQSTDAETPLDRAERNVIGMDHGQVGGMLLSRWKFPQVIVTAVSTHHLPGDQCIEWVEERAILLMADSLAREIGIGDSGNRSGPSIPPDCKEATRVEQQSLNKARRELSRAREGIEGFFEALR